METSVNFHEEEAEAPDARRPQRLEEATLLDNGRSRDRKGPQSQRTQSPGSFRLLSGLLLGALFIGVVLVALLVYPDALPPVDIPPSNVHQPRRIHIMSSSRSFATHSEESVELQLVGDTMKNISGIMCFVIDTSKEDSCAVEFVNRMSEETIFHFHGLNPPSSLDGVPFLSAPPLPARSTLYSHFVLKKQTFGTYFMHSHLGYQASRGASTPVLLRGSVPSSYPLASQIEQAEDVVMFLQDFCAFSVASVEPPYDLPTSRTCDPSLVFESLRQNALMAMSNPMHHDKEENQNKCVQAESLDVAYGAFLCNNRTIHKPFKHKFNPTKPIRLRVINAASMSNFRILFPAEVDARLIATDGNLVLPRRSFKPWVAVAQRLDFIITTTTHKSFSVIAVAETSHLVGLGLSTRLHEHASALVLESSSDPRSGEVTDLLKLSEEDSPELMHNNLELNYKAFEPLMKQTPDREVTLILSGHHGFSAINNSSLPIYPMSTKLPFTNPDPIEVQFGERVHINIKSTTMHPHSMHLHGHRFQVLSINGNKIEGPMRDTILVPGCSSVVIAFDADNPGRWAFHCHMEFHMLAGMFTTVEYRV